MRNKRKISSLLINPDFQGKFLALFVIFGFFQAAVNYYAVYFSFKQVRTAIEMANLPAGSDLMELVSMQEFYVFMFIGLTFALSFLIVLFVGLRFTHHAAGALYRIKSELQSMTKQRSLHPITLRENDFFRDVETAFNDMVTEVSITSTPPKSKN